MNREEVYKAIDSERDYQDRKWKDHDDKKHHMADWILFIERHLGKLKNALYKNDWFEVQESLRKTAALGVAASEAFGIPVRYDVLYNMDEKAQKFKADMLEQENLKNEMNIEAMIIAVKMWDKADPSLTAGTPLTDREFARELAQKYVVKIKTKK